MTCVTASWGAPGHDDDAAQRPCLGPPSSSWTSSLLHHAIHKPQSPTRRGERRPTCNKQTSSSWLLRFFVFVCETAMRQGSQNKASTTKSNDPDFPQIFSPRLLMDSHAFGRRMEVVAFGSSSDLTIHLYFFRRIGCGCARVVYVLVKMYYSTGRTPSIASGMANIMRWPILMFSYTL